MFKSREQILLEFEVKLEIASNCETSSRELFKLYSEHSYSYNGMNTSEDRQICKAIALNPNISKGLWNECFIWFPNEALKNIVLPLLLLEDSTLFDKLPLYATTLDSLVLSKAPEVFKAYILDIVHNTDLKETHYWKFEEITKLLKFDKKSGKYYIGEYDAT